MPRQKPGRSRQCYVTPVEFMQAVESRFGRIDFDLAATRINAKAPHFYTAQQNALRYPWIASDRRCQSSRTHFWLNPPYRHITPWVRRATEEQRRLSSGWFLVLLPASVGSNWFRKYVFNFASVYFLEGRICFNKRQPYPKDCMLLQYRNPRKDLLINIWDWKRDKLFEEKNNLIYTNLAA